MKLPTLSVVLALGVCAAAAGVSGATSTSAPAAAAQSAALTLVPLGIPQSLQNAIDNAQAACNCFTSVSPWEVDPIASPAEVFSSADVFYQLLDLDAQLPWTLHGEINKLALTNLLGNQAGLVNQISADADPSGGGFRLGAYKWRHMTQPDYCSGETVYLMYFPRTGVLYAFRFDSSSEC